MLILGIDPGSRHTGWGLIEQDGERLSAIGHGRLSLPAGANVPARLALLHRELDRLLARRRPDAVVLETPFHGLNARSLVILAQARGALLAAIAAREIEIHEYSPAEVKSAVAGDGRAGKDRVARMVALQLSLRPEELSPDAADALAVALCYARRRHLEGVVRRGTS